MNSYGSESVGEVSLGTASMAFTGHRSQPGDAARQPFTVNDSGGGGGGSRPFRGSRPSRGQSSHSAAVLGDTPMDVEMGPALAGPLGSPMPDPRSISIPGIPSLPGAQPSLSGVRPPPGFTGTPRGPGNFQVGANASHQAGTTPPQ